ncbi:hypothetical protein [Bacillus sp. FJAT-44742]|uniref:hypothetical protein n=1 Tax=Bacillus sp. FJAT-44742 TaxID=2014005 RepID=UPI000C247DEF|nr:hypothetical protein [Bacillus sp. FJAT-44742]
MSVQSAKRSAQARGWGCRKNVWLVFPFLQQANLIIDNKLTLLSIASRVADALHAQRMNIQEWHVTYSWSYQLDPLADGGGIPRKQVENVQVRAVFQ